MSMFLGKGRPLFMALNVSVTHSIGCFLVALSYHSSRRVRSSRPIRPRTFVRNSSSPLIHFARKPHERDLEIVLRNKGAALLSDVVPFNKQILAPLN